MKIDFKYDEKMDMKCLLSKGGGSTNSPGKMTKTYISLIDQVKDLDNENEVKEFIRRYISENKIDIHNNLIQIKSNWEPIEKTFEEIAYKIFGLHIEDEIIAYLTITGRHPYNIDEKLFYVSAKKTNVNCTIMHELWHFYTFMKFGSEIERLGIKKYNDIKESLTVLLNIECVDLLGGEIDKGYPQHHDLRNQIAEIWMENKDINYIWKNITLKS